MTLKELQEKQVYLGTSSWKYPGWRGLVYKKDYSSEKAFKDQSLEEYAEHYGTVGVDHTYYDWPRTSTFDRYVSQTPAHFRFGLKVTERITVLKYPNFRRYGDMAGKANPDFLNAELFRDAFIGPLEPYRDRLGTVILEFSQFYPAMGIRGSDFVERLHGFFQQISGEGLPLAVEIRNANWLQPLYFEMLKANGVAHVFNSWTRMPSLKEQWEQCGEHIPPYLVSRILLQPGTKYAQAVEAFSPYDEIQEGSDPLREDAAGLIQRAIDLGVPAYVFVNNRAEGCAPKTIEGIAEKLH